MSWMNFWMRYYDMMAIESKSAMSWEDSGVTQDGKTVVAESPRRFPNIQFFGKNNENLVQ